MDRGRLVTLEGGEGAGKSTQARLLGAVLEGCGVRTLITREPGGTRGAEAIRRLLLDSDVEGWQPLTEALLHNAARHEHVVETIAPALAAGRWVICDRFVDSTAAYQGRGQGVAEESVVVLQRLAVGDLVPDLTLMLDIPVSAARERIARRSEGEGGSANRYEGMDMAFHERLRAGFLDIAAREPERCALIDAGQDIAAVGRLIREAVHERLGV